MPDFILIFGVIAVIPAKAGTNGGPTAPKGLTRITWIPAFAGMTGGAAPTTHPIKKGPLQAGLFLLTSVQGLSLWAILTLFPR